MSVQTSYRPSGDVEPGYAFWSIEQMVRWAKARDVIAAEASYPLLPDWSASLVHEGNEEEQQWLAAAKDALATLRAGALIAIQDGADVHPSRWNEVSLSQFRWMPADVVLRSHDVMALSPKMRALDQPRASHEEVVIWCAAAIDRGLTGQKKAEEAFSQDPMSRQTKREAFRKAFNEAKAAWRARNGS